MNLQNRLSPAPRAGALMACTLMACTLMACAMMASAPVAAASPDAIERAAKRIAVAVATAEVIPAARGTLKQQGRDLAQPLNACIAALPVREVAAKLAYPLADDFTADEMIALARFLDTPTGSRIEQGRAQRLESGRIDFALPAADAEVVRGALPAALAKKWSAGAALQPNTMRAMRTVLEERRALCDKEPAGPSPAGAAAPAPATAPGMPANASCSRPQLQAMGTLPERPVTVTVRLWVGSDGAVSRTEVERSSGVATIDNAARRAGAGVRCRSTDGAALAPFTVTQSFTVQPGQ